MTMVSILTNWNRSFRISCLGAVSFFDFRIFCQNVNQNIRNKMLIFLKNFKFFIFMLKTADIKVSFHFKLALPKSFISFSLSLSII